MTSLKEIARTAGNWLNPPSAPGKRQFLENMAIAGAGFGAEGLSRRLGGEQLKLLINKSVCLFGGYYIVRRGDSLYQIALQYYNDASQVAELAQRNDIVDPKLLRVGQSIWLPPLSGKPPTRFEVIGSWGGQLQRRDVLTNGQWQPEVPYSGWPFWHARFPRMVLIHRSDLELAGLPKAGMKIAVFENWQHERPAMNGWVVNNGTVVRREAVDWGSRLWSRCAYDPTQMILVTCHPPGDKSANPPQRMVFSIRLSS